MAKQRSSVQKRQREMQKRQRELRKTEKAAEKRKRRNEGNEGEAPGGSPPVDDRGIPTVADDAASRTVE